MSPELNFPFGGRSDHVSNDSQDPMTTRKAENVRGRDPVTGRVRGAQRAGLSKFNSTALASTKVREMCCLVADNRKLLYGLCSRNLIDDSEAFDPATTAWVAGLGTGTVTNDTTVAPDGTQTADTLDDTDAVLAFSVYQDHTPLTTGEDYTFSIYLKEDTAAESQVSVTHFGGTKHIDVKYTWATGAISTVISGGATASATTTQSLRGFVRIEVTIEHDSGDSATIRTEVFPDSIAATQLQTIAWGAQFEQSSTALSYCPNPAKAEWEYPDMIVTASGLAEPRQVRAMDVDRQSNIYALVESAEIVKFNPDGEEIFTLSLPVAEPANIVRAIHVDDFDCIYAGVSEGGNQDSARMWKYVQLPDNSVIQLWEIEPGAFIESVKVYRDKLVTVQNSDSTAQSHIRVYGAIDSASPDLSVEAQIAYPVNDMDLNETGEIFTAHPEKRHPNTEMLGRPGHPNDPHTWAPYVDWTPDQLSEAKKRIRFWFRGDGIQESDAAEDLLEDGQEITLLRDTSEYSRHMEVYPGSVTLPAAYDALGAAQMPGVATGAFYRAQGIADKPTLYFETDDVLTTGTASAYISQPNSSVDLAHADAQRTMLPTYAGSMYCLFMVLRPAWTDTFVRWPWFQGNTGTTDYHGVGVDMDGADAFAAGEVAYHALMDNVGPPAGGGGAAGGGTRLLEDAAARTSSLSTDAIIVTCMWDNAIDWPGALPENSLTRCVFRVNGRLIDRAMGAASFGALLPSVIGLNPLTAEAAATRGRPYRGHIAEIIVLDRINRLEDGGAANPYTEPKIVSYDPLDTPGAQTINEMTMIEGYLGWKYGVQVALQLDRTSASLHPFGVDQYDGISDPENYGPPPLGSAGYSGSVAQFYPMVAKYDSSAKLRWVYHLGLSHFSLVFPYGTQENAVETGGVGYGVKVAGNKVYCIGVDDITPPETAGGATPVGGTRHVRCLIDEGETVSFAADDGGWVATLSDGDPTYTHPRMDTDEFESLYVPLAAAAGTEAMEVYDKDGTGSGAQPGAGVVLYTLDGINAGEMQAVRVDPEIPDYTPTTIDIAQFVYLGGDGNSGADEILGRYRLVDSAAQTGSTRTFTYLANVDSRIRKFTSAAITDPAVITGFPAVDPNSEYVQCAVGYGEAIFVDGVGKPIVYNSLNDELSVLGATSAGLVPEGAKIVEVWRERLVLARFAEDPHIWWMSALGDFRNWDLYPPVPLSTQSIKGTIARAGRPSDVVNALIPATDDLLLVAGDHMIQRLTGDPLDGGQLDLISDSLGMPFGRPWCKDTGGRIFFFGNPPGLYLVTVRGELTRLTMQTIEESEFEEIDFSTHYVRLFWNQQDRGVHIFQMPFGAPSVATTKHWFWEEKTHTLVTTPPIWTDTFGAVNLQPTAAVVIDGDQIGDRKILVGTNNGFIQKWDQAALDDDGTGIDSQVIYGPLVPRGAMTDYKLTEMDVVLADDQQGLFYEYFATEEADTLGGVQGTGGLGPGRNPTVRKRVRGPNIFIRFRNAKAAERWAYESGQVTLVPMGRKRPT
jgi:hypothetical protein